jgi:DNA-binding response OmpR family regulator
MHMLRALIVDDDAALRVLLSAILKREGFSTAEARDGEEAVELLDSTHFDLVILDVMMPRLSGHDVLSYLAAQPPVRPNVIVLSAASEKQLTLVDRRIAAAVLRKPFDLAEFVRHVHAITRRRNLLLVEDDDPCAYLISRQLQPLGFDVTRAHDGAEAIRLANKDSFDAFVVDLKLPRVSGYEVISSLRRKEMEAPVIIVLTVLDEPEQPLERIDAWLQKPAGIDQLADTLVRCTRSAQ